MKRDQSGYFRIHRTMFLISFSIVLGDGFAYSVFLTCFARVNGQIRIHPPSLTQGTLQSLPLSQIGGDARSSIVLPLKPRRMHLSINSGL